MRVVIVTGVSRGLGPAIARVLLDRGLTVLGVGRSSAAGLEGDRYRFAPCDLADLAGIDAALAGAFGALA
ncbi:MAG: SDR family NAD(P)-dependent oxidoreductase, partial [Betaproteobacteria bacterium PRO3]|nr:SDR family NAD(P)-dependent oxidoreductase [Betaproteobacteria bacterium PRO3]